MQDEDFPQVLAEARAAGPWTDADTERIRWLREHHAELTDAERHEKRVLRLRETVEAGRRRRAMMQ